MNKNADYHTAINWHLFNFYLLLLKSQLEQQKKPQKYLSSIGTFKQVQMDKSFPFFRQYI